MQSATITSMPTTISTSCQIPKPIIDAPVAVSVRKKRADLRIVYGKYSHPMTKLDQGVRLLCNGLIPRSSGHNLSGNANRKAPITATHTEAQFWPS